MTGAPSSPRFIVIRSPGSLFVVYDRVQERSIEGGRRFQPARARAEADRLNADVRFTGAIIADLETVQ